MKAHRLAAHQLPPDFWPKLLTISIDSASVIPVLIDKDFDMPSVTVSPKYQVVIPRPVRDHLHIRPGQKMQMVEYDGRIELVPDKDIKELRGFLRGIDTSFDREGDRL